MNNSLVRLIVLSVFVLSLIFVEPRVIAEDKAEIDAYDSCDTSTSAFITWFPEEVTCPICQTKQIFMVPGSWGSYIYQYSSKYQLIFWPHTDSPSWHSCAKCRYTAFMGDFKDVPKEKIAELQQMLKSVTLPPQKEIPKDQREWNQPYMTIPSSDRLLAAEKVYRTLGRTDDYWAHFYRVLAYHLERDNKPTEAAGARRKALTIIESWLAKTDKSGRRKEFLYVSGAMHHFLKEDEQAMKLLKEAKTVTYNDPSLKKENNEGYDGYLSKLIDEYIQMLEKGEGPRNKKDVDH